MVGAGAFVRFAREMSDVYEGFLPAREWGGREYFQLDESETALVGRRSGSRLAIGDPVTVRVNKIEAARGRVDLLPGGEAAEAGDVRERARGMQGKRKPAAETPKKKGKKKGRRARARTRASRSRRARAGGGKNGGSKGKRGRTGGNPRGKKR